MSPWFGPSVTNADHGRRRVVVPARLALALGVVSLLGIGTPPGAYAQSPRSQAPEISIVGQSVVMKHGGRQVLEYVFVDSQFKPYVRQLATPEGVNVLRDQVPDHLHHHGLMFGFTVGGTNFWEETAASGRQRHRDIQLHQDGFTELIDWRGAGDGAVLLIEDRRIALDVAADAPTVLSWTARFNLPPGTSQITLSGPAYNGLGARFLTSMDRDGAFLCLAGRAKLTHRDEQRLVQGPWCAYTAAVNGKPVTMAMFHHPDNVRPATWFTMTRPFAYLSATLGLPKPLTVRGNQPLLLRYGVALWDGRIGAETIGALFQGWLSRMPGGAR
jgi:hypothetical protein